MYQLQVLRKAREDMQKSANWYDKQMPELGDRFLLEVISTFKLIESNPLHYQEDFLKHSDWLKFIIFHTLLFSRLKIR